MAAGSTVDPAEQCIYYVVVPYIHFTWDSKKALLNRKKHDVSFEEARSVFFDPEARFMHDPEHSTEEDRFILLGLVGI